MIFKRCFIKKELYIKRNDILKKVIKWKELLLKKSYEIEKVFKKSNTLKEVKPWNKFYPGKNYT